MSSDASLPSVSYADYKRAIRLSKRSRAAKEVPKNVRRKRPSDSSKAKKSKSEKEDSNESCWKVEGSESSDSTSTKHSEAESSKNDALPPKSGDPDVATQTNKSSTPDMKEDTEVLNSNSDDSDDLRHDLTIEASFSDPFDEGFEVFDSKDHHEELAKACDNLETNLFTEDFKSSDADEFAPVNDQADSFQLRESTSYNTNDDSVFSKEGPRKESPQRQSVVVHTNTSSSNDPSARRATIDMAGCIRTVSTESDEAENPQKLNISMSSADVEEVVSEQANGDKGTMATMWEEFGSSLGLLGTPVLSWFSGTASEGVAAAGDEDVMSIPSEEPAKDPDDEKKSTEIDQSAPSEQVTSKEPALTDNISEELNSTASAPCVEMDKANPLVLGTSMDETLKKQLTQSPSSMSSTDGGSLSSHDVVEEKDGFVSNDWYLQSWLKAATSWIVSKRGSPQQLYLFLFGAFMISAIILIIILLLLVLTPSASMMQTSAPSSSPTVVASMAPSDGPSVVPSISPTSTPTITPRPTISSAPSETPSAAPSEQPSFKPSDSPTITAAPTDIPLSYVPGKLTVKSNGLLLSEGLTSRIVARSGEKVFLNGRTVPSARDQGNSTSSTPTSAPTAWSVWSDEDFHFKPDGAAAYPWPENDEYGGNGWIYVSNSEVWDKGGGGVGAIYFNDKGRVVDYQSLIKGTTANCAGGKTPWHTWVSCEEADDGRIFQIDPKNVRPPEEMTMGMGRGKFESFAYDIRDQSKPRFFATEDKDSGALRRFTPDEPDWEDPWTMLQASGILDFLILEPFDTNERTNGTFFWSNDQRAAKDNARRYYQNTEGIDVRGNQLYVVSKIQKELFILNLDAMTYEVHSTVFGLFDGQPDQLKRLISDDDIAGTMHDKSLLYFCEEGGRHNGVHARDRSGWYFTILESDEDMDGETSGLAFSPDGMHMYFSYQHNGIIFDVWREDGRPFHAKTLSVKYHETGQARSR